MFVCALAPNDIICHAHVPPMFCPLGLFCVAVCILREILIFVLSAAPCFYGGGGVYEHEGLCDMILQLSGLVLLCVFHYVFWAARSSKIA